MSSAEPLRHTQAIAQITADALVGGQYVGEISRQYIGNCHYDWQTSRLIWAGDRLVHHWSVWGYPARVGSIQLNGRGWGLFQWRAMVLGVIARPSGACDVQYHAQWSTTVVACQHTDLIKVWPLPVVQPWYEDPLFDKQTAEARRSSNSLGQ